jgi:hypothetical protein
VAWIGLFWLGKGKLAGFCEFGNDPSDSIKCGVFLDKTMKARRG